MRHLLLFHLRGEADLLPFVFNFELLVGHPLHLKLCLRRVELPLQVECQGLHILLELQILSGLAPHVLCHLRVRGLLLLELELLLLHQTQVMLLP